AEDGIRDFHVTGVQTCALPILERQKDNPWPEWPKVYRLDYGQEEAASVFGGDPRVYLTTAKKFVADDNGHVKEVHTVEIEWEKRSEERRVGKEGRARRSPER